MPPRINRNANRSSNNNSPTPNNDQSAPLLFDTDIRAGRKHKQRSAQQEPGPLPISFALERAESDSDPDSMFGTPRRVRGEPEMSTLDEELASEGFGTGSRNQSVSHRQAAPSALTAQRPRSPASETRPPPHTLRDDLNPAIKGHSRTPVFARDPTTLESLSRTVRSYLPSSAPFVSTTIPPRNRTPARSGSLKSSGSFRSPPPASPSRVAPAPPLVSRPVVSLGRFTSSYTSPLEERGVFDFDGYGHNTSHEAQDEPDSIFWSRFDSVDGQQHLILGYSRGLQIWNCSNLGQLNEVLNIPDVSMLVGAQAGEDFVKFAAFLHHQSEAIGDAPLLGLVLSSNFVIYSLARAGVIRSLPEFQGAVRFESNANYIVLATDNPPCLHILSATTYQSLHTIPAELLSPAISPAYTVIPSPTNEQRIYYPREETPFEHYLTQSSAPQPIFALNGRLLAYASPPPQPTAPPSDHTGRRRSSGGTSISSKIGGTVLSGMKLALTTAVQVGTASPGGRFFSKSAPVEGSEGKSWQPSSPASSNFGNSSFVAEKGHYVTILDLKTNREVVNFNVGLEMAALAFSKDGTRIVASSKDGTNFPIFSLASIKQPHQQYSLRRGRTPATIDQSSVQTTTDGLWLGVSTRNRTLHVFAVNPYGGRSDAQSHVEGRVRDPNDADLNRKGVQNVIQTHPLVRIRALNKPSHDQLVTPLTFTFIKPSDTKLPRLLSPKSDGQSFHDILVFDAMDGVLSLHRFSVDVKPSTPVTSGPTSASLPTAVISGLSAMMDKGDQGLVAKEGTVASWPEVRRKRGWGECQWESLPLSPKPPKTTHWLSQAELTASQYQRSVYLSHQLLFYTLGEDYHALIRRHQFNTAGTKIDVRREVHPTSSSENFFAERAGHRLPLNEALTVGMDHTPPIATLPMYPNGTPRSWTRPSSMSLGNIPIKSVTDGVTEGLGRIRREITKTRSPVLRGTPVSPKGDEGLEFDEQDEDFLLEHPPEAQSEPEPVPDHEPPALIIDDDSQGWEPEETERIVEDMERFDNITVVGFLEEEQEELIRAENERKELEMEQAKERRGGKKARKSKKVKGEKQ